MPDVVFAVPGDLHTPTGGYIYDRRVMELLPELGWNIQHLELPGDYPAPSKTSFDASMRLLAAVPSGALIVMDGLALGALPPELIQPLGQTIVGLVHHPLALETGISEQRARYLARNEKVVLHATDHVIVTSAATARTLVANFEIPTDRISVAPPGTDRVERARDGTSPLRLISVGAVSARKGYDLLVNALARVADLAWECRIVGSLDRDPDMVAVVRAAIRQHQLEDRIHLLGAVDQSVLSYQYNQAQLFISSSYYEGYGMALTEAMARGLPVVGCAGGAVSFTVPAEAGMLVEPGNADALAMGLRRFISDPSLRHRSGDYAWRYAQNLPTWKDTALKFADALRLALENSKFRHQL